MAIDCMLSASTVAHGYCFCSITIPTPHLVQQDSQLLEVHQKHTPLTNKVHTHLLYLWTESVKKNAQDLNDAPMKLTADSKHQA